MTDPRVAAVEDNLLRFFAVASSASVLRRDPDQDVVAIHCDVPFPMFNAVTGARFGADAGRRTAEVVDAFVAAGVPWMWWLTPSTTSPEIEAVLEARGLERDEVPGMYADLAAPPRVPAVPGLSIERTDDVPAFVEVMMAGFGLPDPVREPMDALMRLFPETINLVASLEGRPVACGTAYPVGATAGLYNIATVEAARSRGIGYAVTVALMDRARDAGADHAVLHSSQEGQPVYERAGFVEVCKVPQYIWMPPGSDPQNDPENDPA